MTQDEILAAFDRSAEEFNFPMLDNGYIYPAASRLSMHRAAHDWALVIETFGFSPRAVWPDLTVTTITRQPHKEKKAKNFASQEAYTAFLDNNRNTEIEYFSPISNEDWIDPEDPELVRANSNVVLRGRSYQTPSPAAYAPLGIKLENAQPAIFELCRYFAELYRRDVLATLQERHTVIGSKMTQLLVLDAWQHPDLAGDQTPSQTETFQQIAAVLASGDPSLFTTPEPPNNHWSNWPDGGTL